MSGLPALRVAFLTLFGFLFFNFGLFAEEMRTADVIILNGHLGKEAIDKAKEEFEALKDSQKDTLVVEVDSTSGDILQVLDMARVIYEAKVSRGIKVVVYINGSAIGPASAIPFVADELLASVFVSWGGTNLGEDSVLPTNILRSRIRSLISNSHPQHKLMTLIAEAMVDPAVVVVDDRGWKRGSEEGRDSTSVVSPESETLVIDHNQLQKLGLATALFPRDMLKDFFDLTQEQVAHLKEQVRSEDTTLEQLPKDVLEKLSKHIQFDSDGKNTVGRITIDNKKTGIDQSTWIYVKSALDYYKEKKPVFIILELNTPGGEVFSSQQISDALMDLDTNYSIPTVAFIDNWAVSAGAMLAYSCRFIGIVKDATMGAAEPVLAGAEGGMQTASEKINSALRADFANRAGFYDRETLIAEAMVDKSMILVLRNKKVLKLETVEQIITGGSSPDVLISAEGKLLTLDAQKMMLYGVADFMVEPMKLEPITALEEESGEWPAEKYLLFSHSFFKGIPGATIETYKMDWKLSFFAILASPAVASLLFMGMMVGFYVEMNSPGFGLPGSVALVCLFFIVLSSFSLAAVSWLEVIILLAGLALLAVELLILPGFGIAGIVGGLLVLVGLFALMLPSVGSVDFDLQTETFNAAGEVFMYRLAWLCSSLIMGFLVISLLARFVMPKFTLFNRLVLVGEESSSDGFVAGADPSAYPSVGSHGEVLSTLRPSGKVMVDDEVYDAMSRGGFIEKGIPIIVVQVERNKVIVEESKTGAV
ncbi:MAG: membrane-bound serine protease (ClpP class) [Chlamydiales bacterium]|jgi:membrane-bound serine protease (ClpP class)